MKKYAFITMCLFMFVFVNPVHSFPVKIQTVDYFAWARLYDGTGAPLNTNPYDGTTGQSLAPLGSYKAPDGTEDAWGITQVQKISDQAGGVIYWEKSSSQELTVFFYGADDVLLVGPLMGYYGLYSLGFKADMYLDDSPDYDPNLGTLGRTGLSTYTNVTDGTKVLALQGHSLYFDPPANLQPYENSEIGFPSTGAFSGTMYFDVAGGDWAWLYDTNTWLTPAGTYADIRFTFTTLPSVGVSDWVLKDVSTADADVIPEPGTMLLLGTGLIGLAGMARRKFKKNNSL